MALTTDPLEALLRRTHRRQRWHGLAPTGAAGALALALVLAGAVALDAAVVLPPAGRWGVDAVLVIIVAWALGVMVRRLLRLRFNRRRLARLIEDRAGMTDSALITAVELRESDALAGSPALRSLAVARGTDAAIRAPAPARVIDLRPAWHAGLGSAGVIVALLVTARLACPGLLSAAIPRLADPSHDHPPFTRTAFHVTVTPGQPNRGGVTIHVEATGPHAIDSATVVWVDGNAGDDRATVTQPMTGAAGRFDLVIPRLATPDAPAGVSGNSQQDGSASVGLDMTRRTVRQFYIRTPMGRSCRVELPPLPDTMVRRLEAALTFPAYTGWPTRGQTLPLNGGATLRALAGTRVTLTAHVEPGADGTPPGTITFTLPSPSPGTSDAAAPAPTSLIPLTPLGGDNHTLTASFNVVRSGQWELRVASRQPDNPPDVISGEVECLGDAPPAVALIEPAGDLAVPLGWPVTLRAQAQDDVAVAQLRWRVSRARAATQADDVAPPFRAVGLPATTAIAATSLSGPMTATGLGTPQAQGEAEFDPAKLDGRVGDQFTAIAIAVDNHPGGGQAAQSEPVTIRVVSDDEYRSLVAAIYGPEEARTEVETLLRELARQIAQAQGVAQAQGIAQTRPSAPDATNPSDAGEAAAEQAEEAEETQDAASLDQQGGAATALAGRMRRRATGPHLNAADAAFATDLDAAATALEAQGASARELRAALAGLRGGSRSPAGQQALAAALARFRQALAALAAARTRLAQAGANLTAATAAHVGNQASPGSGAAGAQETPLEVQGPHTGAAGFGNGAGVADASTSGTPAVPRTISEQYDLTHHAAPTLPPAFINGVPERYRALAEAYFRRLAEGGP